MKKLQDKWDKTMLKVGVVLEPFTTTAYWTKKDLEKQENKNGQ